MKKISSIQKLKQPLYKVRSKQVRIIGGTWKRTPLVTLESESLRPTPSRVRESLFNWLSYFLSDDWHTLRCLDLFAGTGALGFEAASRGALQVQMIENNIRVAAQLEATKIKLNAGQIQILVENGIDWLAKACAADDMYFDLIFLDPPYHKGWLEKLVPLCWPLLTEHGLIYLESEFKLYEETYYLSGWEVLRSCKTGMVFYHLLKKKSPSTQKNYIQSE